MIVESIEDKNLLNVEINDEIGTDKEIIGTFVKNTGKITIQNLNHQHDDLKDKYIKIKNFGSWYVNDLINNEDSTEADLSLYDISNKFDEEYNADLYSFPCTFGEWATKIGENVGVPLKGTFLNYDLEIKEAPFLGTNPANKDAVKFIAKYASGYVQINRDDTYSIKWFDNKTYEIEDWEAFNHGNESKSVNKVVLSTGDTGDNECWPQVESKEPHEIKIIDDWTNIDRKKIIEGVFNQLNGFKYTTITKLDVPYGLLDLRVGQKIKAQDVELKYITTYISGHKLSWDGGDFNDPNSWSSSITMSEIAETSTKHSYSENLANKIKRTERTVDKQNQIIKDVVESTSDAVSKVAEIESSLDGIKLSVDETNNKFDKEIVTSKNATGNPIEIDDAGEYKLESIRIKGKHYQNGTPISTTPVEIQTVKGIKNKFDKNNIVEGYRFDSNGALLKDSLYFASNFIEVDSNSQYIINIEATGYKRITLYDSAKNLISVKENTNKITTTSTTKYIRLTELLSDLDKTMLEKGTTIHNYVPFGRWLEQVAKNKEGKINSALINMNKSNVFDGELELGNIDYGVNLDSDNTYRSKNYLIIKPNTLYSLCLNGKMQRAVVNFYDENKDFINTQATYGVATNGVFKSPINAMFLRFRCYGEDKSLFENANIEIYEDYGSYYEFAEVGNIRDDFLDGTLTKNINKIVLTGDEDFIYDSSLVNVSRFKCTQFASNIKNGISTHFKYVFDYNLDEQHFWLNSVALWLCVEKNINTVEKLRQWLKNQYAIGKPVIIYYVLDKPQTYKLEYERLQLHKGYNYITLNDELYPDMQITYLTDSLLNATFSTHAQVKIESDKITNEVEKSTKYLGKEIENTKSQITQEAGKIKGEVSDKFEDYSTTTQTNAAITTAIENHDPIIELAVSKKVDNIKVGAANLVKNSAREITVALASYVASNRIDVTPGETLAISFDVKGASAYTGNLVLIEQFINATTTSRHSYTWITGTVKTTYSRIQYLYTVPPNVYSIDFGYRSSSNVVNTFKNVQIERGNKFTDYKPSSEDYSTTQEVNGKLELKVGVNDNDQVVSMLNASAQEINLTSNRFSMKSDYSSINKNGIVDFKGGKVGGWTIGNNYMQADSSDGTYDYRTFLQGALTDAKGETWALSTQRSPKGKEAFERMFVARSDGYVACKKLDVDGDINTVGNIDTTKYINGAKITTEYGKHSKNKIVPPGWFSFNSNEQKIPSGQYCAVNSAVLSSGRYIFVVEATFASNKTGLRAVNMSTTAGYTTPQIVVQAINGVATRFFHVVLANVAKDDTTFYVNVMQNSGVELSCWANFRGFQIQ